MQLIHYVISSTLLLFKYQPENLVMEVYWGARAEENNEPLSLKWVDKAQKGTEFVFLGLYNMAVILKATR